MANRYFSSSLGNTKDSGVTEASSSTSADFVELRIDETQGSGNGAPLLTDILVAIERIRKRLVEDQRYG